MIHNTGDTALDRAMRTAEKDSLIVFHTMAQYPAATMVADWRQCVNRTLKTVEYMSHSAHCHIECFVIFVSADFANGHK